MKYGLDIGHNAPPDTGARGIRFEDELTMAVGTRVKSRLEALGHQVVVCTPKSASSVRDSLEQRCAIANRNDVDFYVSIHFNSYNAQANGVEVFCASPAGRKYAQPVLEQLLKLGYNNRGVKEGNFYVLKNTDMPSILIECAFCDAAVDMNRFNADATADAIVAGLTGGQTPPTAGTPKPAQSTGPDPDILRLQRAINRLRLVDASNRSLVEDGVAGPTTRAAKLKLKQVFGISQAESSDPQMWQLINNILVDRQVLRPNHSDGPLVRYLQFRFSVAATGFYDEPIVKEVVAYQRRQNLTPDGILGPATWGKLTA